MAHKAIPLETRNCKGCGVEFQTTDPRKWFHRKSCGRSNHEKQTNAWLLANRPNFPNEPCRSCGKPVVQYRTRRYESEMRYCGRSCLPLRQLPKTKPKAAEWPPKKVGSSCMVPVGCKECATGQMAGLCPEHHNRRYVLIGMISTRLKWLLPRTCKQCHAQWSGWGRLTLLCSECSKENYSAQRRWMRIKRRHRMSSGSSSISPSRLYARDGSICHICIQMTDHPSVWSIWKDKKEWLPNAPTVDHIIPLAKGGKHDWGNVALAHWRCNSLKSDTLPSGAVII